jgi:ribonuclease HI
MNEIIIFCDGACLGNPGPGGAAAIVATSENVEELGIREDDTTNNRMELRAALSALGHVLTEINFESSPIKVFTDSQYVIQGASKWVKSWDEKGWINSQGEEVKNQDLWRLLHDAIGKIKKKTKIHWIYVEGHAGIPGNERVDTLALMLASGKRPTFYRGARKDYSVDLIFKGNPVKIPPRGEPYYLSLVGRTVYRDKTWKECEARVKGTAGVKYKKCRSPEEEAEILKSWGLS